MPPDSIAGLTALAAAPPGAAFSAGPPLPESLSASLFAAFLAQSSPPVMPAAPKAAAMQTLTTDPKQTPLEKQALPKLKTMDTLPLLSFPPALKAKVNASELLLSQIPGPPAPAHRASAESRLAPETPSAALPEAGQAIALPVFAVPVFAVPVLLVPVLLVPLLPAGFVSAPASSAPVGPRDLDTQTLSTAGLFTSDPAPFVPVAPPQTGPPAAPPATPQPAPALPTAAPASALPAAAPAAGTGKPPEPMALSAVQVKQAAGPTADALPRVVSPIPAVPLPQDTLPQDTLPQDTLPQDTLPQDTLPQDTLPPAAAGAAFVPAAAPAVVAAVPQISPAPSATGLLKPAGLKTGGVLASTLKPSRENADTSTRTPPGQAPAVIPKAGVPAAAPEPMPEKHPAAQKPSETAESGTNSGLPAPPMGSPADVIKTRAMPLTAGERAEVVRQAADGVGAAALPAKPGAVQQMSVQLHPKDWGSLQVSVTVAPSQEAGTAKTVTAHIVAETPQVKAALQSQTGALHQALRASGLHLEHLTVSVKTAEAGTPEVKPAAQSASAGFSSGHGQSDNSGQSYGQPNAGSGTEGFGNGFANGFGAGGSPNNRQGQPQAFIPAMTDAEPDDAPAASLIRLAAGRIDTHA